MNGKLGELMRMPQWKGLHQPQQKAVVDKFQQVQVSMVNNPGWWNLNEYTRVQQVN